MNITPNEVHSIEDAGMLDNSPVKMIRTKGGFWIAVGKPKGKMRDEALAAGSHPAIVRFNLKKNYMGFQPSLMKSEGASDSSIVERHSHFLSEDLRKSGHDIYSVQDGLNVEFHITKHEVHVATVKGSVDTDHLTIKELAIPKEFAKAMAGATVEKATSCDLGLKLVKN